MQNSSLIMEVGKITGNSVALNSIAKGMQQISKSYQPQVIQGNTIRVKRKNLTTITSGYIEELETLCVLVKHATELMTVVRNYEP